MHARALAAGLAFLATLGACAPEGGPGAGGARSEAAIAAEEACRAALVEYHGIRDVRILGSEALEGGARRVRGSVLVSSEGKREVWACTAAADGSAGGIDYVGPDTAAAPASPTAAAIPDVGFSPDVPTAAVEACVAALEARSAGPIDVVGTVAEAGGSAVYMEHGRARAPWQCRVAASGADPALEFLGDEGTL
jgi:hypothetical protein